MYTVKMYGDAYAYPACRDPFDLHRKMGFLEDPRDSLLAG